MALNDFEDDREEKVKLQLQSLLAGCILSDFAFGYEPQDGGGREIFYISFSLNKNCRVETYDMKIFGRVSDPSKKFNPLEIIKECEKVG